MDRESTRTDKTAHLSHFIGNAACGPNASAGTNAQAVQFGEVIVLATPWETTQPALAACGNLKGKVLVDCTNPL